MPFPPAFRRCPTPFRTLATLAAALLLTAALAPARASEDGDAIAAAAFDGPSFARKPRWELGVGGGVFSGFDYPASDDPNRRAIALPFFVYRSPVFRVGEGGVRAVALERPRVRLDLSVGGSLNASSEGNGSREGMPDLDFLIELGPQIEISLIDRALAGRPAGSSPERSRERSPGRLQLTALAELRAVVATDFRGIAAEGFVAEAGVEAALRRVGGSRVDLLAGLGARFADERLHDYFYEVAPRYATPSRAAFDADGGYLGTDLFIGAAIRPHPDLRVFLGVQSGLYRGAANADSPLFETGANTGVALGAAWTIARSRRLIEVVERD